MKIFQIRATIKSNILIVDNVNQIRKVNYERVYFKVFYASAEVTLGVEFFEEV